MAQGQNTAEQDSAGTLQAVSLSKKSEKRLVMDIHRGVKVSQFTTLDFIM
jgi:hypothetical protein